MAFRYPLQSILRLRRSMEHQEEQRLLALAAIVARLRSELETLQALEMAERRAALQGMEDSSTGAQLHFGAIREAAGAQAIQQLTTQLRDAERDRVEQLKIYHGAKQKREIFESLRKHQQDLYDLDFARREQQRNDEAFLLRSLLKNHD
jgi:flagellar export protein FliJ